jgi:predicted MPP superfamily phosphohydrolase
MEDLQCKRRAIEAGLLKTWSRRGHKSFVKGHLEFLCAVLRPGLRLTGLRSRGEKNALSPVIREIRLGYDTLPEEFCGFKILHLSDIHADGLAGLAECIRDRVHGLQVDLCVLTGDYRYASSGTCRNVYPNMETILSGVAARYGILGILGNHDVSEEIPELERMGVRMLINGAYELRKGRDHVWVIGVDDPHYYGCDDLPGALRDVPRHAFKILLVHTPELIEEAEQQGIHLYLCGHTHGGQICLPWLGPVFANAHCARKFTRGVWKHGNLQGYTSPGVGASGVPVRFFCPPEIGLIELRCSRHVTGTFSGAQQATSPVIRQEPGALPTLAEVR